MANDTGEGQPAKTGIVYSVQFSEEEKEIFEGLKRHLTSEDGLVATLVRALDQMTFLTESMDRLTASQGALLNEVIATRVKENEELMKNQLEQFLALQTRVKALELQGNTTKSYEEVVKKQAGQSSAIQSLDKRLKNIEMTNKEPGGQKASWRDVRNKPQQNGSSGKKAESATPPAVPTTNEKQNANNDQETAVIINPAPQKETSKEKTFENNDLQEQVQKLAANS